MNEIISNYTPAIFDHVRWERREHDGHYERSHWKHVMIHFMTHVGSWHRWIPKGFEHLRPNAVEYSNILDISFSDASGK